MDEIEAGIIQEGRAYIDAKFGGDFHAAFDHYDSNQDGRVSGREVVNFLYDARIGTALSRWAFAVAAIQKMDADRDGEVSIAEIERYAKDHGVS